MMVELDESAESVHRKIEKLQCDRHDNADQPRE